MLLTTTSTRKRTPSWVVNTEPWDPEDGEGVTSGAGLSVFVPQPFAFSVSPAANNANAIRATPRMSPMMPRQTGCEAYVAVPNMSWSGTIRARIANRMRSARRLTVSWLLAVLGVVLATTTAGAQTGVDELLARVSERVAVFYKRAQSVICIETSTVQPIDFGYSAQGFARTVESELRVEAEDDDAAGEVTVVREVGKVDGRAARGKDGKDRAGWTDPTPLP